MDTLGKMIEGTEGVKKKPLIKKVRDFITENKIASALAGGAVLVNSAPLNANNAITYEQGVTNQQLDDIYDPFGVEETKAKIDNLRVELDMTDPEISGGKGLPKRYEDLTNEEKEQFLELTNGADIESMEERITGKIYFWYITEVVGFTQDFEGFKSMIEGKGISLNECRGFFGFDDQQDDFETKMLTGIAGDAWCEGVGQLALGVGYDETVAIQPGDTYDIRSFPVDLADMSITLPNGSVASPTSQGNIVIFGGSNGIDIDVSVMPDQEGIDLDQMDYRNGFDASYTPYPVEVSNLLPLLDLTTSSSYSIVNNLVRHSASFANDNVESVRSVLDLNGQRIPMGEKNIPESPVGERQTVVFEYSAEVNGVKIPAGVHGIYIESKDRGSTVWRRYGDIESVQIPQTFEVTLFDNGGIAPSAELSGEYGRDYYRNVYDTNGREVSTGTFDGQEGERIDFDELGTGGGYLRVMEKGSKEMKSYNIVGGN